MILRLFNALERRVARVRAQDDKVFVHYPASPDTAPYPADAAFKRVAFWNEDLSRISSLRAFEPPALFVEILPLSWIPTGRNAKHADAVIRLHLVTATLATDASDYRREWERRFILGRALQQCLVGFASAADQRGLSFSTFRHLESIPDHNHDQIAHDIYTYTTHAVDASAVFENNMMQTPVNVTLDTGDVFDNAFSEEMC